MNGLEVELASKGYRYIAGVDEAGRGPLAGPVVAASVVFPLGYQNSDIKDSKALSPSKRESIFFEILSDALSYSVGVSSPEEIDSYNIHNASLLAMERSVTMLEVKPDYIIVDGRFKIPHLPMDQKAVTSGDRKVLSVAAASIVAKVTRDTVMEMYHDNYPEYNFSCHKGYPTVEHKKLLKKYGPSPIHRISFRGVRC
jgi:ribonuclease HII